MHGLKKTFEHLALLELIRARKLVVGGRDQRARAVLLFSFEWWRPCNRRAATAWINLRNRYSVIIITDR
jgi:hypothetical protein